MSLPTDSEDGGKAREESKNETEEEDDDDDNDEEEAANDIISTPKTNTSIGNKRSSETRKSVNSMPTKQRKTSSISTVRNENSNLRKDPKTTKMKTKELVSSPKNSNKKLVSKKRSSNKISSESESDSTKSIKKPVADIRKGEQVVQNQEELQNNMAAFTDSKGLGKHRVNIQWFQAPRPDYMTRPIDESFLALLMNSFRTHTSGHLMRQPLHLNLSFTVDTLNDQDELYKAKTMLLRLKSETNSKKAYGLLKKLRNYCLFETIGGNHTRTACQKILESDPNVKLGYDGNHTFDTMIGNNLSVTQARIVGLLDNVIKNVTKNLSNFDKVNQTRQVWRDRNNISNPSSPKRDWNLKNEAFESIVKIVFYDPSAEVSQKVFNQKNPFVKGCHIPQCAWPTFSTLLQKDILTITHIRNYCYYDNKNLLKLACAKLDEAVSNNSDKSRIISIFKSSMDDMKFTSKIAPHVLDTYRKLFPETKSMDQMFQDFKNMDISFSDFYDHKDLSFIKKKKGKQGGLKIQELAIINSIIKEKIKMFENLQRFKEQKDNFIYTSFNHNIDTGSYETIPHVVLEYDAYAALQSLCKSHTFFEHEQIGIIFLDPPFGILDIEKDDWDVKWTNEYWENIFNLLHSSDKFKNVPIIFFGTLDMICELFQIVANNGYHQTFFVWEKFNLQSQNTGFITNTSSPVILYHPKKSPSVMFHDPQLYAHSQRGRKNLLVCSYDKHVTDKDGQVVNSTQKPVDLYRNFIFRFCPPNQIVLDICAGSGTGALAAASFGYSSISIDNRSSQCSAIKERIRKSDISSKHPQHVCSFKIKFEEDNSDDEKKEKEVDGATPKSKQSKAKSGRSKKKKEKGQALSQPVPKRKSRQNAAKPIVYEQNTFELGKITTNVEKQAADIIELTDVEKQAAANKIEVTVEKQGAVDSLADVQVSDEELPEEDGKTTEEEETSSAEISKDNRTMAKKFFDEEAHDKNDNAGEKSDPFCDVCSKNRVNANYMCIKKGGEAFCSEKCFKSHCLLCNNCKAKGGFIDHSK